MSLRFTPLGDQAIIIEFDNTLNEEVQKRIRRAAALLDKHSPSWIVESVPAFTTIAVFYNPLAILYEDAKTALENLLQHTGEASTPLTRILEIPVCYGGKFGPDLEFVASHNELSVEEVIKIHSHGDYSVSMIGFAPGFPFITGMSEKIAAPRKESPRLRIPERSVGIAGIQTGIYPIETPGGWQLIGRTPLRLFQPEQKMPSLLKAGDKIKFHRISEQQYHDWEEHRHAEDS